MSSLKNIKHATMTDAIRQAMCQKKAENPKMTQGELAKWLETEHDIKITQATVSNTLKRTAESLNSTGPNRNVRRHREVKYPVVEESLYEWFLLNQERINMSGDILKEKAANLLKLACPLDTPDFNFSNGWLDRFKRRHNIKSFRRFGESGSVDMQRIEEALPRLRAELDQFEWRDIYNMDETGLFYRMQADHSLATSSAPDGSVLDRPEHYS